MSSLEKINQYKSTLKKWVDATKITQKELVVLTSYFWINPDSQPDNRYLSESQFSRALNPEKLPSRSDAIYNVLTILGLLYGLNIVSKTEIEDFLNQYQISIPSAISLEIFWKRLEIGRDELQQQLQRETSSPVVETSFSIEENNSLLVEKHHRNPLFLGVAAIVVIGLFSLLIAFQAKPRDDLMQAPSKDSTKQNVLNKQPVSASTSLPVISLTATAHLPTQSPILCNVAIDQSDPIFLADQGYSLFEVPTEKPGGGILISTIRSIGVNQDGVWVGYAPTASAISNISFYDGKTWTHYCLNQTLQPGQFINSIAFNENSVYIATDGAGVGQLNGKTWAFYNTADGLYSNSVYELDKNKSGLWAATYNGVAQLIGSRWSVTYTSQKEGLISDSVHTFLQDRNGNRWFGTINRGISRLSKNGVWESFYTDDIFHRDIRRSCEDAHGGIWFATDRGGLLKYSNGVWENYTLATGALPNDQVYDVEKDKYGRIWAATEGGLVYTPDLGKTWVKHSSLPIMDIEFGCPNCKYEDNHIWLVVKDRGLGHVRIPPLTPTINVVSVPEPAQLEPGQEYIFEVKVKVVGEQLDQVDGDSLRSLTVNTNELYGAYPIIGSLGVIHSGEFYIFSNTKNPIIAPAAPGIYRIAWRVWQGRRFVTEPIIIEFEVIEK